MGPVISDRWRPAPRWTHFGRSPLPLTALPMLSLAWETRHATRELNEPVARASAAQAMHRHVGCWPPVERARLSLRLRLNRLIRPSSTASDGSKCQVLRPSGTTGLNELDATPHGAQVILTGWRGGEVVCCQEAEAVEIGFGDDRWRCGVLWLGARLESRDSGVIRSCPAFVLGRARRCAVVYQLRWGAESMPWLTVTGLVFRP
jgi:hypothetical protein